ncbi:hypothetical protein [Moritella yayanosii]|uniref:Tyr recombinase domain-containing protein n=1 Tax=Moritella yayanosii TaxID=69539 RepID=A0A330LQ56_9GAMM|nr:hypothetical protein [Moritella yayanosii]SQD79107.1 protein of unknown function, might belong to Phage integrase [Moritella yayanosii]
MAGGLDGLRIHDLRHSFAFILINSGKGIINPIAGVVKDPVGFLVELVKG